MNFFELYQTINENQEQKNNILATALEGTEAGNRYFFQKGNFWERQLPGNWMKNSKSRLPGQPRAAFLKQRRESFSQSTSKGRRILLSAAEDMSHSRSWNLREESDFM